MLCIMTMMTYGTLAPLSTMSTDLATNACRFPAAGLDPVFAQLKIAASRKKPAIEEESDNDSFEHLHKA